ncbi:tetratricopeptide repeat protein, partial [Candidatus Poribacteria bacterium]|nr:tetratricopeptide repeat protein [Candidatus Poribacteria bacterium]
RATATTRVTCHEVAPTRDNIAWEQLERAHADDPTAFTERRARDWGLPPPEAPLPWTLDASATAAERHYRRAQFLQRVLFARDGAGAAFVREDVPSTPAADIYLADGAYVRVAAGATAEFVARGPALLKVRSRLDRDTTCGDERAAYVVEVSQEDVLDRRFYHLTARDDGVVERALGRVRTATLVVPPGERRYRVTPDADVLIRVDAYRKNVHAADAITHAEDIAYHLHAAYALAHEGLEVDPLDARARYVRAASLILLGEPTMSEGAWLQLSEQQPDVPMRAAALHLLARIRWHRRRYDEALSIAIDAHDTIGASPTAATTETLARCIASVRAEALRALGRHAEAAAVLMPATYDDLIAGDPYHAASRSRRWRFWWDETGWTALAPTVNPLGRARRAFDRVETSSEAGPGAFRLMPVGEPFSLWAPDGRVELVCDSRGDRPWILDLRAQDGGALSLPVLRPRERFALRVPPGGGAVTAVAPPDAGPVRLLARGGVGGPTAPAWVERRYVEAPARASVDYDFDVPADTYLRILARSAGPADMTLHAALDGAPPTPIRVVFTTDTPGPAECRLPVPAGRHRLSFTRADGSRQPLMLALAVRDVVAASAPLAEALAEGAVAGPRPDEPSRPAANEVDQDIRDAYRLLVTAFGRGDLEAAAERGAAFLLAGAVPELWRLQARYVLANCAARLSRTEDARAEYTRLCHQAAGDDPARRALRRQVEWEMARLDARDRLAPTERSPDGYAAAAEYNRGWVDSPHLRWREDIRDQFDVFDLDWARATSDRIVATTALRIADETGEIAGPPYHRLVGADVVTAQIEGPTIVRVYLRTAAPTSPRPGHRDGTDVIASLNAGERARWRIAPGATPASITFADCGHVSAGQLRVRYVDVPSGSHTLRLKAYRGAAAVRVYTLRPGPNAIWPSSEHAASLPTHHGDTVSRYDALVHAKTGADDNPVLALRASVALNVEPSPELTRAASATDAAGAQYRMAAWFYNNARRSEAQAAADNALEAMSPDHPLYADALLLLARCQDPAVAVATYRRYLAARDDDPVALHELAAVYRVLGDGATDITERTGHYGRALNVYERLRASHPELRGVERGRLATLGATEWQSIYAVEDAAGAEAVDLTRYDDDEDGPWPGAGGLVLSEGEELRYALALAEPIGLRVEAAGAHGPGPGSTSWRLRQTPTDSLVAAVDGVIARGVQRIPAGKHVLSLRLSGAASSGEWVRVLADRNLDNRSSPAAEDGWWPVAPVSRVTMQVATQASPVTVVVKGPTRLRVTMRVLGPERVVEEAVRIAVRTQGVPSIQHDVAVLPTYDEYRAGRATAPRADAPVSDAVQHGVSLGADGLSSVEIAPQGQDVRVLVRLHARVARLGREAATPAAPVAVSWRKLPRVPKARSAVTPSRERSWPPPSALGTFELRLGYGQSIQEGIDEQEYPRYGDVTARHRLKLGGSVYQRAGVGVRKADALTSVVGLEEALDVPLPGRVRLLARADLDLQSVDGATRHTVRVSVEARRSHRLAPTVLHVTRVRLAARAFS